jgi:hypothetical protein
MKKQTIFFLLLCFFPVLCGRTQSITHSDAQWENLTHVKPGTKISVRVRPGEEINGNFTAVDSSQIYMNFRKEQIRLKRENIKSVIGLNKISWKPSSIAAAAIGFAIGAALGNYFVSYLGEGYDTTGDHLKAATIFGLAGASAGIVTERRVRRPDNSLVLYESD